MSLIRVLTNYLLVLTSPLWVLPAFAVFFYLDRKELPAWTKGGTWFWENEPAGPAIISPTRLIDDGRF